MYASISHSYIHLVLALGIVKEPIVWGFITSKYLGIHDIGRANTSTHMHATPRVDVYAPATPVLRPARMMVLATTLPAHARRLTMADASSPPLHCSFAGR